MTEHKVVDIVFNNTDGTVSLLPRSIPTIDEKRLVDNYAGNLLQYIHTTPLSEHIGLDICRKLYLIVREIHKQGIVHGSICAGNVILKGGAICLANARLYVSLQHHLKHLPLLPCTSYRSKEDLLSESYTPSKLSDIYALTVLFYTIFSGAEPYSTITAPQRIHRIVRQGHLGLSMPSLMPSALWSALVALWNAGADKYQPAILQLEDALR